MGEPAHDTVRQRYREDIRRRARVIAADLPLPPPRRLLWWLPLTMWATDTTLRATGVVGGRWAVPMTVGGLILTLSTACLLEGWHAQKRRDGDADLLVLDGEGQQAGLAVRVRDCELTNEMLIETLIGMCDAAGIKLDRPNLRAVDGGSRAPVA